MLKVWAVTKALRYENGYLKEEYEHNDYLSWFDKLMVDYEEYERLYNRYIKVKERLNDELSK